MPEQLFTLSVRDTSGDAPATDFPFDKERISIGRSRSNDLVLKNNAEAVSRRHAEIRLTDGIFYVVDLGSKNTTTVNGRVLESEKPYPIRAGDRLDVGDFEIIFTPAEFADASSKEVVVQEDTSELYDEPATLLSRIYTKRPQVVKTEQPDFSRAVTELVMLSELAFEISAGLSVRDISDRILKRALQAVNGEEGVITLAGEEESAIAHTFIRIGSEVTSTSSLSRYLLYWMEQNPKPVRAAAGKPADFWGKMPRNVLVKSILCVPLIVRSHLIGVLTVFNKQSGGEFTVSDERLLAIMAAQSAQVIENARIYEAELRAEAAELRAQAVQAENRKKEIELEKARELEKAYFQLKETQSRLIQQEKLASLGRLTAGIAHELRNPLNFINNFAQLCADLASDISREVQDNRGRLEKNADTLATLATDLQVNTQKIIQHGARADSIVRNMMLLARRAPGKLQSANLNTLLEEAVNMSLESVSSQSGDLNLKIERVYDSSLPEFVIMPQEISSAFVNLVTNAIHAVLEKTARSDESYTPHVLVATQNRGPIAEICIRDNGVGIAENLKERIFEPFFTTKSLGQGIGLGLSLVYEVVVHLHGGKISVETAEGEYTMFIVELKKNHSPDSE